MPYGERKKPLQRALRLPKLAEISLICLADQLGYSKGSAMKSSAENAKEALAASLKAIRSLEGKGVNADLQMDAEIARNVMKEEIGEFGEFNQS